MTAHLGAARLSSFLVKVASRCNLDCDYCYVYHHADQGWRSMPRLLSQEDRDAFAARLAAYVAQASLHHVMVVFHGGEPLLMGGETLALFALQLRAAVGPKVQLDISMQTNGLLLTEDVVTRFAASDVGISLSLDGPKAANDLHRTTRRGRSSHAGTMRALTMLQRAPEVFAGVITVIDPRVPGRELLEFFHALQVPRLDFLLPDAHHLRPPPGRLERPDLYERWLIDAFDAWFDDYPSLQVRTFEALLDAAVGLPSHTDAFGFGDVSLITVETDGSYHDLDVLKVVAPGATRLAGTVRDTAIADVAASPRLAAHRAMLRKEGLCETCQTCDVVDVCGGGAVPHRYGSAGFKNPTIYCREMRALIRHVKSRLATTLAGTASSPSADSREPFTADPADFERAEHSFVAVEQLWSSACTEQGAELRRALAIVEVAGEPGPAAAAGDLLRSGPKLDALVHRPGTVAWSRATLAHAAGRPLLAVDGSPLPLDTQYVEWLRSRAEDPAGPHTLEVHAGDPWLRRPFGAAICFEDPAVGRDAGALLQEALAILGGWRPAVARELRAICHAVQFVRDPAADPDKIVSFSDNAVPGALFVSVMQRGRLIDAYDLADSLLHEYRHQKLYLLERICPVVEPTQLKVVSPWREDLRPPSGLFHAIFVFVELRRFWKHVRGLGVDLLRARADHQIDDTDRRLAAALKTLATCALTATGAGLAQALAAAARE